MWIYVIAIALAGGLTLSPQPATAEIAGDSTSDVTAVGSDTGKMTVVGVAMAEDIQGREPVGSVTPSISCEKGKKSQVALPVVNSTTSPRVFFWNRVQSSTAGTLRHTWLMKRDQGGWEPMAKVDLRISQSPGYRTWSSKQFDRSLHLGEWMVQVSKADDTSEVLCLSRFRVE